MTLLEYFQQNVTLRHTDLILLLCYTITGLLDSSAVFIWGSFVSMQTGNTVYLGLGLAGVQPGPRWIKSGLSIASFCLGSLCFGAFYRFFHPHRRWVLCVSFAVQMSLIIVAAIIMSSAKDQGKLEWQKILPLCLVAFQSSGQAVTSRALELKGLTSVVLTSVYCDFMASPQLFTRKMWTDVEERRRVLSVLCLVLGTVVGALLGQWGMVWSLGMAALLKGGIVGAWIGWRGERIEL